MVSDITYGNYESAAVMDNIGPEAIGAVIVGHEAGHAVLHRNGLTFTQREEERLADCLSGVSVKATSPELGEQAAKFFVGLDTEWHGLGEDRRVAFNTGFSGGIAACSPDLTAKLGIG